MTNAARLNPRKPFRLTARGKKRIVVAPVCKRGSPNEADPKPLRTIESIHAWTLVVVSTDKGVLSPHSREALATAAILADQRTGVLAAVLGDIDASAGDFGADRVAVFPEFSASKFDPENEIRVIEALIRLYEPSHIIIPDDAFKTADLGRRLIAKTKRSAAAGVCEVSRDHVAIPLAHPEMFLARAPLPELLLLRPGVVDTALPFRGAGERIHHDAMDRLSQPRSPYRDLGTDIVPPAGIALEDADLIIAAGHGVANTETVAALASTLGAAVGASRVAVDEGKYPRDRQVGATGKTVTSRGYIAVGISGAVQHLQGITACQHVIAINKDPGAPIVQRADLTVVGDAEEIMQALITRISEDRAQREQNGGVE